MTVCTQPNPRLIPGGDKRFPFPPGWVHPFEGPHSGMHHMTTKNPKPPPATSASNVVPLRESVPTIESENGWQLNTEHGFMRWDSSAAGRLVSLAEVADSLSANLPRAEVVYRLWSPLIAMASDGNEPAIYVTNSQSYAKALIANGRPTQHTSDVWEFLPSVDGRSSAEDVFRDLADGWDRCWKGFSDPSKDVRHSQQQARARSMELDRKIYWPEDGFLLTLLSRVAVPLAVAADLWGWGKVAPSVDAAAKPAEAPPAADKAGNPSDASDGTPAWLTAKGFNVAWLQGERDRFRLQGGHYMSKLIEHLETKGVHVPGKDKKKEIDRYTDGKPREKKASPWGGLGASKKVGAR